MRSRTIRLLHRYSFCTQKPNFYKLLQVSPDASFQQIKQSYLERSKTSHPDSPTGSQQAFISIQQAYKILSDSAKRKRYDVSIGIEYSLWQQEDFGLKNTNFENQEQFQAILSQKGSNRGRRKSTRDMLFERFQQQIDKKPSCYGLLLPGILFIGFWMIWETAQTFFIAYKGDKQYEAKVSDRGKNFSSFVAQIR